MSAPRETSLREYHRRINAVLDYLQANLGDDHALDDLARIACFSPWHFHRVFRDRFGCTPGEWRARGFPWERDEDRKEDQGPRNQRQAPDPADHHHDRVHFIDPSERNAIMSHIDVHDLPAYRVAYLRHTGPYDHAAIGQLWQQLGMWAGPRGLMQPSNPSFGVSHDNPEVTPPQKCRYDACVAIPDDLEPDGPVTVTTLPAGKYAVLHVRCLPQEIGDRFADVFQWLTQSGWQPDQRPCYQRYGADCEPDPETQAMTCDLCVPVKPL